jgi:RNA polymerase-binding protein
MAAIQGSFAARDAGRNGVPELAGHGDAAPRVRVSFWCCNGHQTVLSFAADAPIPDCWDCPRCGRPAGQDKANPPTAPRAQRYKTHLAHVRDRRSDTQAEAILAEALANREASRQDTAVSATLPVNGTRSRTVPRSVAVDNLDGPAPAVSDGALAAALDGTAPTSVLDTHPQPVPAPLQAREQARCRRCRYLASKCGCAKGPLL